MSNISVQQPATTAPNGASRLALLDPVARGTHAALTALGTQLAEHAITVPYGVLNGDLVIALRDTAELRTRLTNTKGATYPAAANPAVRYYLEQIVRLADQCAHARRAYLPGYDALSPDVIRLTVVSSCRDAQGLELAIAYEPGNVEIALEVVANPTVDHATVAQLVHRWVSADTTAPDEKRLAVARAVIDHHHRSTDLMDAVTDGCMHMVNNHHTRELEAAFETARTAVRAQAGVLTTDQITGARDNIARRMDQVRPHTRTNERAARELTALEMVHEAMTEHLAVAARRHRLPKLLEEHRNGKRLTRREARELARAGAI